MEEKKKEEKIIYPSPLEFLTDTGDYLVLDPDFDDSVSFIEGVKGIRIPKDYLSDCLKRRFINEVETNEDSELFCLDQLTEEIIKAFDDELKHFMQLWDDPIWGIERDYSINDIIKTYISYVLKSELYKENIRINGIIQSIEESDKSVFYDKLRHQIQFPGETEEERQIREAEFEKRWKKILGETDETDKE